MNPAIEIPLIAALVAAACSLPGAFLLLRGMAMMSDAITHTILLGIVLAFLAVGDLNSPLLMGGAALMGVFTVWLTETLGRTRLLSGEASIGIVFPFLFSLAVMLITRHAGSVHLDTDTVLLGELAFAPFDRLVVGGIDRGPKALYTSGALLVINAGVIVLFYKELRLAAFDALAAAAMGFIPGLLHYVLMTLVSVTAVGAFQAVGSILVVSFMIGPPATAYLLTEDLKGMLFWGLAIGVANGVAGYLLAVRLDVSIAGCMAVVTGLSFALALLLGPRRGLIVAGLRRRRQGLEFVLQVVRMQLYRKHGGIKRETLQQRLGWRGAHVTRCLNILIRRGQVQAQADRICLTPQGREQARLEDRNAGRG